MLPSSFKRPSDWPGAFGCTDFIFLRSSAPGGTCNRTVGTHAVAAGIQANQAVATCIQAPGGGKLAPDQAEFIAAARAKGRKLMVMTFSSMPVGRDSCNCSGGT